MGLGGRHCFAVRCFTGLLLGCLLECYFDVTFVYLGFVIDTLLFLVCVLTVDGCCGCYLCFFGFCLVCIDMLGLHVFKYLLILFTLLILLGMFVLAAKLGF